jgi:murein DD-endopeptidase MepM/ murein hydrolase activator NlpD
VDALAMRVGAINAHVIRLDALGKRLTQVAGLHPSEFNFDQPVVKAPAVVSGRSADLPVLTDVLDRLADQITDRERKMGALENVVLAKQMGTAVVPQGAPIAKGFISSQFGRRSDPFTGYTAFHPGVDFAGKVGDPIAAVAAGIVTWAGPKVAYGYLVEIDHGNDYVTRYAHNEQILVQVGDTVQKGQAVALMGSSGHSTGPHVHFEVLLDGNPVNPMGFISHNILPTLVMSRP